MPTKRKDGRWQEQLTITEGGRPKQKYFYGKTKQEVLKKIAAWQQSAASGPPFSTVADDWWAEKEREIADGTVKSYYAALSRARAWFGSTPVTEITPVDVRRFMADYVDRARPAKKTAVTQRQIVRNIMSYACRQGYIDTNPVQDIELPRTLKKTPRDLPSDAEIRAAVSGWDLPFGMFALFLAYTGLRRGELLALTWEDVDLERGCIHVTKSLYYQHGTGTPQIKEPKTAKGTRTVPLLNALRIHLQPGTGLIFPSAHGGYMRDKAFRANWQRFQVAAGVTCTPHQLRHAFATMLYDANVPAKDAQDILGHAQLSTTQDIYTHIREARREKLRTQLAGIDYDV